MDKNRIWLLVGALAVIICVCVAVGGSGAAYFMLGRQAEDADPEAAENVPPPSQFDEQDDNSLAGDLEEDATTEAVEQDDGFSTGDFADQFPAKGDINAPVTITEFSDYG